MKILFLPKSVNPYQGLLAEALKKLNVEVDYKTEYPSVLWLIKNRNIYQVLHIHWPHRLYKGGKRTPFKMFKFICKFILTRIIGYKIIWTVHNLMPHEKSYHIIDKIVRRVIVLIANNIIVHCKYAEKIFTKQFGRKKNIFIIPHGNYLNLYNSRLPPKKARLLLGIEDDAFVYLYFGKIRSYKGIENLLDSFKRLKKNKVNLLIAGKCNAQMRDKLNRMSRNEKRIKLFLNYIPDENVHLFFSVADVFVAPFSNILTSGSVILGLSFGLPIIAPALGCLPELVIPPIGILYDIEEKEGLLNALQEILKRDHYRMGQTAFAHAATLSWETIAQKTLSVYSKQN
jgi:glycosyltransferase involved in cell wall biosynthesis